MSGIEGKYKRNNFSKHIGKPITFYKSKKENNKRVIIQNKVSSQNNQSITNSYQDVYENHYLVHVKISQNSYNLV